MQWCIDAIVRLIQAFKRISTKKWSFVGFSALIFLGSIAALARFDLLPEALPSEPTVTLSQTVAAPGIDLPAAIELPTKIEIPSINLSAPINNPTTTDITALDRSLLSGAVRYPTSAKLGETGNVVLFGHSSYLPVVLNKAYQSFNDIQKLAAGATIAVSSKDTVYTYQVRSVEKESTITAAIPLRVDGRVLTLSTCDSFGAKTDRFVVTADFVESHPLSAPAE
ncbi:sortase [Patescibacteria group bacterium]|nr:sortase [Patescibacteria group bacterium]